MVECLLIDMIELVLVLSGTLIVCLILLNELYKRTVHFSNSIKDIEKFKEGNIGKELKMVVIGSNHPKYAFDFDGVGINGANWAIGPEAFEYDYIILKKYINSLAEGAVVIIPICLLNFFLYRFSNTDTYLKYYQILEKEEFPHYCFKGKLKASFPVLFNPSLVKFVFRDVRPDNQLSVGENLLNIEELKKDADKWVRGWEKQFDISIPNVSLSKENEYFISKNICLLNDILELCVNNGLTPVISLLPVTKYLRSRFTDEFVEKFILGYINDSNKTGAPVLNYLSDERFTDSELYINSFFFNTKGRKAFTKQFVEDLKAQSIL